MKWALGRLLALLLLLRACESRSDKTERNKNPFAKYGRHQRGAGNVAPWKNYEVGESTWIVPYRIHKSITDDSMVENIYAAFRDFHNSSCLIFLRKKSYQRYYILFKDAGERANCETGVGQSSQQDQPDEIWLNSGCKEKGDILHLIMHKLGFYHEHQRPDRDDHVTIHTTNIKTGSESEFDIIPDINSTNSSYDFESILHVNSSYLASDVMVYTITKTDGSTITEYQRDRLSLDDVAQLNILYGCGDEAGYVCENKYKDIACEIRLQKQLCRVYPTKMKTYCPKTCKFCRCRDVAKCRHIQTSGACYVPSNIPRLQTECSVTCGYCGEACVDLIKNCELYVGGGGVCEGRQSRMARVCRRTCGYCLKEKED